MNEKYSQQVINLSLPPNLVSHSERATASIIGGVKTSLILFKKTLCVYIC